MENSDIKNIEIEELILRFCEGKTSIEETKQVEEWLDQDSANQDLIRKIQALNLAIDAREFEKEVDTDIVFNKVKRRISKTRWNWWNWTMRAAAVLSVPLLLSTWWFYYQAEHVIEAAQMITATTYPGMRSKIWLPDSTLVILNSESMLSYPSKFNSKQRQVKLKGEAYFDVRANKDSKFTVSLEKNMSIEVYGTKFNVDAYDTEHQVSTTLLEGSVGFIYQGENGKTKSLKMKPNQKLIYLPQRGKIELTSTHGQTETAWVDGQIIFKNTPIKEALHVLSKQFNVNFILNHSLENLAYTGRFEAEPLEMILKHFEIATHIRWQYIDNTEKKDGKRTIEIY